MVGDNGFDQLFQQIIRIFWMMTESTKLIWEFLSTPLAESVGADELSILGDLANYAPLEFMFGLGIIIALVRALVKFFIKIF